jgi:hypothetical protein
MRIIRLGPYTNQDRIGGCVFNSATYTIEPNDILFFGIDPFCSFPAIPYELISLPKIISISDLHHGINPVTRCMRYAHEVRANGVLIPYNIGIANTLRSFGVNSLPRTLDYAYVSSLRKMAWSLRSSTLLHTGRLTKYHNKRVSMVSMLPDKGVGLFQFNGSPAEVWEIGLSHKYHLNIPINNDRNCRFWETLLCGGLLFQPRLPEFQFADIRISQDELCVPFESIDDLVEKFTYFYSNPMHAEELAMTASKHAWTIFLDPEYSDLSILSRLASQNGPRSKWFELTSYKDLESYYRSLDFAISTLQ